MWFLFYPTIVGYLFASINCYDVEESTRLYDDLEELCFEGQHLIITFLVTFPGLILWAFGMPILGFFMLKRFMKTLKDNEFHSDPSVMRNLTMRFKLRLGFLT